MSVTSTLKDIVRGCGATLPLPGGGRTVHRFATLGWAANDLSLARLAEGHVDALAILAEAGCQPTPGATYAVWAARAGQGGTRAEFDGFGWRLSGHKPFCSGGRLIDRALVTADTPDGYRLFDISVADNVVSAEPESWVAVGMADSLSQTLEFGGPPITEDRAIGGPGFYLERPGFWFGAVGVAACWYGGAQGLVDHQVNCLGPAPSDLVLAETGHAVAHVATMRSVLESAAVAIDVDPFDRAGEAQRRAMVVRHAVQHGATQVLGHVAAAGGARLFCHSREQGRRAADLYVYLSQHHGPQDAVALGRLAMERP